MPSALWAHRARLKPVDSPQTESEEKDRMRDLKTLHLYTSIDFGVGSWPSIALVEFDSGLGITEIGCCL